MARVRVAFTSLLLAASTVGAQAVSSRDSLPAIDEAHLFRTIAALAADSMEGRRAGTPGGARARAFLLREIGAIGLQPAARSFEAPFSARSHARPAPPLDRPGFPTTMPGRSAPRGGDPRPAALPPLVEGVNLLGVVRGTVHPDRYIVVSAHYDHLGIREGRIYHGADDNASGSAAILAIAEWAVAHPPQNSILFAWFDAEESGLLGSEAFVEHPAVPLDRIAADVNLDMVSRDAKGELTAGGARHWPVLQPLVDSLAAVSLVVLRQGHDGGPGDDDLTRRSDMGPFHDRGIPFLFFFGEEHDDYHQPTDIVEHLQPAFYYRSVRTIAEFVRRLDVSLDAVAQVRKGRR
jgi:hypothetical protein